MRNNIIKSIVYSLIICGISFLLTALAYNSIPDCIRNIYLPMVSTCIDKNYFIWSVPIVSTIVGVILSFIPLLYRKVDLNGKKISYKPQRNVVCVACLAFLFIQIILLCEYLDYHVSILSVALIALGFIITLIGNYMPRFKKNTILAIYNPWTLSNSLVWLRTHRFGGYTYLLGGLAIILMILVPAPTKLWLVVAILFLVLILPHIYSFFYFRYHQKRLSK